MGLIVPTVGVDPGPDWANNLNASLSTIDQHNHSPGSGVQVTPAGLLINADLPFNTNNATLIRSLRFSPQPSALALGADIGCLYEVGVDLYYNDGNGNQIRITQSGSVTGSSGTITGLPSGTASASYSSGTFSFKKATNTPATISAGSTIIGQQVASGYGVTIAASASQAANYTFTLPAALPGAASYVTSDTSGNLGFSTVGQLPLGSVIATFPSLTGAYSTVATTAADSNGFVLCGGQTISDATSPMNGVVIPNISNFNFVRGSATDNVSSGAGSVVLITANLPSHTHTFTSTTSVGTSNHTHDMTHLHQWSYMNSAAALYAPTNGSFSTTATFTNSTSTNIFNNAGATGAGSTAGNFSNAGVFTAGPIDSSLNIKLNTGTPSASTTVAGTTDATGSGTAVDIIPSNISAVYLMRIK